ncbi:porin [Alkalilimnicola ehrlichii MLHE-1]|uniref:Porin, Gram-negative type n=1 Tax=Alkalilimnicola ehrlichii (strain ATCC BAA-1101 / DSM 17681 / MLHE-1) TaxID=187272 RepID=Q0AAG1_ALKEH|nr:porin [Alkalilimnicola ehrlichii]ABI56176.1 porin, Gram-negative type [Alkalilimnicola ehrlichii MLHE-1]
MHFRNFSIAVAAGALALPLVAQADGLTLYGEVHLSADIAHDGDRRSEFLASRGSLLGITGSEYLGAGLTGLFQYETEVHLTAGGDGLFGAGENAFVGLDGAFGTVLAGHMEDPLFVAIDDLQMFVDRVGDAHLFGATPGNNEFQENVLVYLSPELNGFSLTAMYGPRQGTARGDLWVAHGQFDGELGDGNLYAGLSYLQANQGRVDELFDLSPGDEGFGEWKHKLYQLALGYERPDVWRGFAFYQCYQSTDVAPLEDDRVFGVGVGVLARPDVELLAQVTRYDADASRSDSTLYAVGADYFITDRTTLYAAYAMSRNQRNADRLPTEPDYYGADDESRGVNVAQGDNAWAVSLGVKHAF